MSVIKFSDQFKLNARNWIKSAVLAAISAFAAAIYQSIAESKLPTLEELKVAGMVGLTTGVSYIVKKLFEGEPKVVQIDPAKTTVVDKKTNEVIA